MSDEINAVGDRADLRRLLEARRRQVLDDLQRRLVRIREADPATLTAEGVEDDVKDIDVGLIEIMNATVRRIDAALERLADGGYGRCTRCHRGIGEARLRALPFAVCCCECERRRERQVARQARGRAGLWDDEHMHMPTAMARDR